ncbi:MAG TPA: hypothetical protein VF826_00380 [Chloroflexia bacterium]
MNDLVSQIEALSREQVLEAAGFLGDRLTSDDAQWLAETPEIRQLTEEPYSNLEDLEQLCRLALVAGALTPEYEDHVRNAILGSGKKQFILGGLEIVALAVLAVGALHVIVTKGKKDEHEIMRITEEDGKKTVEIQRHTRYGISGKIASMLKATFGLPDKPEGSA